MAKSEPERIDIGAESEVFLVQNGQYSIVTKHRRPNGKTQYNFEAYAYKRLKILGARVPTVLSHSDDELVMSALSGEQLDDKLALYDDARIFGAIAKDLALCRKVTFAGFGPAVATETGFGGIYKTWPDYLAHIYEQLEQSQTLARSQKRALKAYWETAAPDITLGKGMLVHGDFALSAIFVNGDTYEGLIDFGDAFIGDPLMDLAYFRFKEINKPYGKRLYAHLLEAYLDVTALEGAYVERAVKFYMICWAVLRVHADNLSAEIVHKFLDKTDCLVEVLAD